MRILSVSAPDLSSDEQKVWGFGVGLVCYVMLLNLGARLGISPSLSGWISMFVLLVVGLLIGFKTRRDSNLSAFSFLTSKDWSFIGLLVLLNGFHALLYYLFRLDDDLMFHLPSISLFSADIYPHVNPFFPDFEFQGHFARNLLAGVLSRNTGASPESVIQWGGILLSCYAPVAFYGLLRRVTRSAYQSLFVTAFVFFCLKGGFSDFVLRGGLFEMVDNNNPLVLIWTLVFLQFCWAFSRKENIGTAILLGAILGAYGFVYETYLPFLALGALAAFWIRFGNDLFQPRRLALLGGIALTSGLIALTQGGVFADLVFRGRESITQTVSGIATKVTWGFPKTPFLHFSHVHGHLISIFSWEFLKDQGWPLWVLPVFLFLALIRRKAMAGGSLIAGLLAILIPAWVDFARFNPDTYRILIFSSSAVGVGSALILFDFIRDWLIRAAAIRLRIVLAALGLFLAAFFSMDVFVNKMWADVAILWKNSCLWYLSPSKKLLGVYGNGLNLTEEDRNALERITDDAKKRGIQNPRVLVIPQGRAQEDSIFLLTFISSWAKSPTTGAGIGVPRTKNSPVSLNPFLHGVGLRARAYEKTGAPELLADLKADYLYLFPESFSSPNWDRWLQYSSLELVERFRDVPGERLLFKFKGFALPFWKGSEEPSRLHVDSIPELKPGEFTQLHASFDGPLTHDLTLRHWIRYQEEEETVVNAVDTVIQVVKMGSQELRLSFVAPFMADRYWVEWQYLDRDRHWKPLRSNLKELVVRKAEGL